MGRASYDSTVPQSLDTLMSIGSISTVLALALRAPRDHFTERSVAIQAGVMTVAAAFTFSLGATRPSFGTEPMHAAIIVLMVGFAMLMPLPPRLGIPALAATALVYPITQVTLGVASFSDPLLAAQVVDLSVGFSMSALVLVMHNRLFASRSTALRDLALLAEHDALTGVFNRRTFMSRLAAEANRSERYGTSVGLVIFDVDNFKHFNTNFGYAAGDLMLREVATTLDSVARQPHFKGIDIAVARFGGEEFVALLPGVDANLLDHFAQQTRAAVDAVRVPLEEDILRVTISAGYVLFPGSQRVSPEWLIRSADTALYEAKSSGGNASVKSSAKAFTAGDSGAKPVYGLRSSARLRQSGAHEVLATDNQRLHWLVLRWTIGITATWVTLLILMDVAFMLDDSFVIGLRTSISGRVALVVALALLAAKAPLMRRIPNGLAITHMAFIGTMAVSTFWMAYQTGGIQSPYYPQIVYVVCAWTLAFAIRPAWSATLLLGIVIGYPLFYIVQSGVSPLDPDLVSRTVVLACAGGVAFATQNVFGQLRGEELDARRALLRLARVDPLTGLPNRVAFEERLERLLGRAHEEAPISLVVFDLDHFKQINDTLGHVVGDDALALCAHAVEATVRTADMACRLGGEEFAVALPSTDREGAALSAERLRARIGAIRVGPEDTALSASFGVVEWRRTDTVSTLMARADDALRKAKLQGRDRVVTD